MPAPQWVWVAQRIRSEAMDSTEFSAFSTAAGVRAWIERSLPGVVTTVTDEGDAFCFYDPDGVTDPANRFPFVTLISNDHPYDAASRLDRDAETFRVNVQMDREQYEARFGEAPRQPAGHATIDTGADYAATDQLLPHPLYSPMHWVCVVNPGPATFADLRELLTQAHQKARRQYERRYPS